MDLTGLAPSDIDIPVDNWMPGQLESAGKILASKKRVVILQSPTGSGKSVIVRIPGKIQDARTLILTRTIALQDQYSDDGIPALYGRANYICNRWAIVTADQGICRAGERCSLMHGGCDYYNEKFNAINSQAAVLNYSYFLREANGPGLFTGYDYIVCDEGHSVPQEITNAFSINLDAHDIRKIGL